MKVEVTKGFEVDVSDGYVSLSDGSGNCYILNSEKNASLREKALGRLLAQLWTEAWARETDKKNQTKPEAE